MQVFNISLMKALVYLLAPSSPAFGNASNPFFAKQQNSQSQIDLQLQPTDIIFTRTNNLIYNSSRNFLGIEYDHVAVVINKQQLLHISPPITSRIPIKSLMNKSRSPIVIRPKLGSKQKQMFLKQLLDLLGTKYTMSSIPLMLMHQLMNKLNLPQANQFKIQKLKESRICSDAILYSLCIASEGFKKQLVEYAPQSSYSKLGFMLPDDFLFALKKIYPVIYQQTAKTISKPILQIAGQKLQQTLQSAKKNAGAVFVLAKLMTFLNSNTKIATHAVILKDVLLKNVKIVSLAMLVCDIMGIKVDSFDYSKKLMIITSLMTIIGSALWVNPGQGLTQDKYELPAINKIQQLPGIKPKL